MSVSLFHFYSIKCSMNYNYCGLWFAIGMEHNVVILLNASSYTPLLQIKQCMSRNKSPGAWTYKLVFNKINGYILYITTKKWKSGWMRVSTLCDIFECTVHLPISNFNNRTEWFNCYFADTKVNSTVRNEFLKMV